MYISLFLFLLFYDWFPSELFYIQYFFDVVRNKLPELIKRRSKVQERMRHVNGFKF